MGNGDDSDGLLTLLARADKRAREGRELAASHDFVTAALARADSAIALRAAAASLGLRLIETLEHAAATSVHAGQCEAGLALAKEAVVRLRAEHAAAAMPAPLLAARLGSVGQLFCVMQRWDDAAEILAEADIWFSDASAPAAHRQRMQVLGALAAAHRFAGRPAEAIAVLAQAAEPGDASAGGAFEDRLEVAQLRNSLGQVLLETGQPEAARVALRQCVSNIEALVAENPAPQLRNLLAAALNRLGHAYAALDQRARAVSCLEESVALMRTLVENEGHAALADDLHTATDDLRRLLSGSEE